MTLGDVVRHVKEEVDPETSGLTRYVAGEHMETDELKISRWGEIGDGYLGPAFNRRFRAGQVLYGLRRTYLRKVALAEFDGVCANTTLVLEAADPDRLIPDLLPFIMQTERFHQFSIGKSRGSVNPYVNWSDLTPFVFQLPPAAEQKRIADLLWALEHSRQATSALHESVANLEKTLINESTFAAPHRPDWRRTRCADLLIRGPRNGYSAPANDEQRGFPTLSIGAVRNGQLQVAGNLKYTDISAAAAEEFLLRSGDVLVVRGNGNRDLVGRCALVDTVPPQCIYPDLLIRLRFDDVKVLPNFASMQWNSDPIHAALLRRAKSTNGIWKVNGRDVSGLELWIPGLDEQARIVAHAIEIRSSLSRAMAQASACRGLRQRLLETLLESGRSTT